MALLDTLKNVSTGVVITTSAMSCGVDFVFAVPQAFVVHTMFPSSLLQLKQDFGRGVRGSNLPVVGVLLTDKIYANISQVVVFLSHN